MEKKKSFKFSWQPCVVLCMHAWSNCKLLTKGSLVIIPWYCKSLSLNFWALVNVLIVTASIPSSIKLSLSFFQTIAFVLGVQNYYSRLTPADTLCVHLWQNCSICVGEWVPLNALTIMSTLGVKSFLNCNSLSTWFPHTDKRQLGRSSSKVRWQDETGETTGIVKTQAEQCLFLQLHHPGH